MKRKNREFTLILSGVPELTDELLDALYEAGCADGLVCHGQDEIEIDFVREAKTLRQAVESAIADVEKTGLKVQKVETEEYKFLHDLNQQLAGAAS